MTQDERLNNAVLEQQQSAQQVHNEASIPKKDIPLVQGKLTLDDETIALLSKYYQGDTLNCIKRQINAILGLININTNRYNYSKDYKDAIDYIIALITAGKFL